MVRTLRLGEVMTPNELNEQFGMPNILTFDQNGSLTRARVTLASCEAEVYLQGAQLTHWKPAGEQPVLWLSESSKFLPGKAIRGGIPICFPWFGPPADGGTGPSHGFARIEEWTLSFAALMPGAEGESLSLTFVLGPNERTSALGYNNFRAVCEMRLGRTLAVKLTVANMGEQPLHFEEALHTYFHVADVRKSPITGLASAPYLDKVDGAKEKRSPDQPLQLTESTDRVYFANSAEALIEDQGNSRRVRITKANSATTVVWNPWDTGAATLADVQPEAWRQFLCVEAANTGTDTVTIAPKTTHTMSVNIAVDREARC